MVDSQIHTMETGQVLAGRYRITGRVGSGGMATVYQAEDSRLPGRMVAVKSMSLAALPVDLHAWAREQFAREVHLLASLRHPGLAEVTDFFEEAGQPYLVMDFIPGQTLASLLQPSSPLPVEQVLDWTRQLGAVLTYLHAHQPPVIFRDLKPANILITPEGQAKLIDFGIARFFQAGKSQDTQSLGTPGYAAPEQYGRAQTDARSDLYSLGVVVHQMLTGYNPADSPFHLPPPTQLVPGLDPAWDRLIARATATDPAARYPSVTEFCHDLPDTVAFTSRPTVVIGPLGSNGGSISIHAEAIPGPSVTLPAPAPRSRGHGVVTGGLLLLLALGLGLGLFLVLASNLRHLGAGRATRSPTASAPAPPALSPSSSPAMATVRPQIAPSRTSRPPTRVPTRAATATARPPSATPVRRLPPLLLTWLARPTRARPKHLLEQMQR